MTVSCAFQSLPVLHAEGQTRSQKSEYSATFTQHLRAGTCQKLQHLNGNKFVHATEQEQSIARDKQETFVASRTELASNSGQSRLNQIKWDDQPISRQIRSVMHLIQDCE